MWIDLIRYLDFAMFGVGCAFMLITNVLTYRVLKPPKRLGFLWWHVSTISVSFLCLGSLDLWIISSKLGEIGTWQTVAAFAGFLAFMISQILIFSVELRRYASLLAADQVLKEE